MKTLTFLFFLSPFLLFHCSAQPPAWVSALTNAYLKVNVNSITHWEEKQMTFYNINEQGDSTTVNALYVEGSTKEGNKFTGKIPVTNHAVNPVGAFDITGESCESQCGCEKFEFGTTGGCICTKCEPQAGCTCWCKHAITKN